MCTLTLLHYFVVTILRHSITNCSWFYAVRPWCHLHIVPDFRSCLTSVFSSAGAVSALFLSFSWLLTVILIVVRSVLFNFLLDISHLIASSLPASYSIWTLPPHHLLSLFTFIFIALWSWPEIFNTAWTFLRRLYTLTLICLIIYMSTRSAQTYATIWVIFPFVLFVHYLISLFILIACVLVVIVLDLPLIYQRSGRQLCFLVLFFFFSSRLLLY